MKFANYARKSIYSDKSDSVNNQFRMAKEYAELHFQDEIDSFIQYSDEDYTGANTDRPGLKQLIKDIELGLIDVLIVYQLDRLSRDVRDFSNIYALMDSNNVKFISLKENIDTTTPIGRAMMYVSVVFAQMERETIANRVTDNMIGLAKKGYWTGGNPPVGYVRERIQVNGKTHVTIKQDPEGVEHVKWIFDMFLDHSFSLSGMQTYFKNNGIKTKAGNYFSSSQLYKILSMPYCVEATSEVYDYYESKGCIMDQDSPREKWDGTKGVMIYGRSTEKNKKHELNPPAKWRVCLGKHKPFIKAEKWLAVQNKFHKNTINKTMKYEVPLLKGILKCSCGTTMSVARKQKKQGVSSWYYCNKRTTQGKDVCNMKHIKIELLDQKVLDILNKIEQNPSLINKYIKDNKETEIEKVNPKIICAKIAATEKKIGNLTGSLAVAENSVAAKYIISEIESLDYQLKELKNQHSLVIASQQLQEQEKKTVEEKIKEIIRLLNGFTLFTSLERNEIIRDIIKECTWNGEELYIKF
ncbi:MAG: recombinase family protein [Lachnospiraceae bacterium]